MRHQKSATGFRCSVFVCSQTTGVKTSECGKLLASARTGSIGGVDKNVLHRVPKQLSGESLYNRVVSKSPVGPAQHPKGGGFEGHPKRAMLA